MWKNRVKCLALKAGDTQLDCVRFGKGDRPLVLLPGLSLQGVRAAAYPLAYLYRAFTKEYTVYVFDKRAVVPRGYTIRELAGDLAAAMGQLGLRDADVFGVSQGGMIAQYLAIGYPQLVRRLALGVTASRCNPVMERVLGLWVQLARQGDYGRLMRDMFERMYSPAYLKRHRRLLPVVSRIGKPKDFGRFIALAESCLSCEAYQKLDQIACPVFVIGGRQDAVVTGEASEEMAKRLCCPCYLYEGLGHAAYDEAPDFNSRVYRFLTGGDR